MPETLLRTKLFVPPLRPNLVPRTQLIERLNEGLQLGHKLTLISAPAGFGKTTLVGEWVGSSRLNANKESQIANRIAWLLLDEGDNDPAPRVYELNDRLLGPVLVGVIWTSWHLPFLRELWVHTSEGLIMLVPCFILGTSVFAVVYGEIRIRTGSVWPAVLMHWTGNTIANTLLAGFVGAGFFSLEPGMEWLGSFGAEGVLAITLFDLLDSILYLKRQGQSETQSAKPAG